MTPVGFRLGLKIGVLAACLAPCSQADAGTWVAYNTDLRNLTVIGLGVAPSDRNVLYLQARSLGIYKSTNGGVTWTKRSSGIPDADPGLGHLLHDGPVVHPTNPDIAWAVSNGYVYKTTNGGASWFQSSSGTTVNGVSSVRGVVVDPNDPNHLFAGTIVSGADGGVFETTNGGANWSYIAGSAVPGSGLGNDAWPIALDAANPNRLYCGSPHNSTYDSTDGGHSWVNSPPVTGDASSYEVAINPNIPNEIWAAAAGGTWVSSDYGVTWSRRDDFDDGMISAIVWAPSNPQVAFAIAGGIWGSADGGTSWSPVAAVPGGPRCLAVDPADPDTLYLGTWGLGMFKSTDGGQSFSEINSGLPLTTLIHGQQAFAVGDTMYCILTGNVMYRWPPSASGWEYYGIAPGSYVQIDRNYSNRWYCAAGGLWRTEDEGLTWEECYRGQGDTDVFGFWLDPFTCDRLWVGDRNGSQVLLSTDGGDTWTVQGVVNTTPAGFHQLSDLSGDPYDPNVLLAAAYPTYTSNRQCGYIWRSPDGGATWNQVRDGMFYDDWRIGDGEWSIQNGALYQRVRVYCNYRIVLDHYTFGNGNYECRMRIRSADAPTDWAGLTIRLNSPDGSITSSGWLVYMRQNGVVALYNATDGDVINAAQTPIVANTSQYATIRLSAVGNTYELFVNGDSIGTYVDNNHRYDGPGYFGLATCRTESDFDDVNIQTETAFADTFDLTAQYGASYSRWLASDTHNAGVFALSTQGGGVWRSTDHGASWQRITDQAGEGLVNYRPMYSRAYDGNLYVSRGAGYSWRIDNFYNDGLSLQQLGQGLSYGSINLTEDPIDPDRIYAAVYAQGVLVYEGDDVAGSLASPTTVLPDFDGDGDVDQADFGHLQACLSGAGVTQTDPACLSADLDKDLDVDGDDLAHLRQCMSGADVPADPACDCAIR